MYCSPSIPLRFLGARVGSVIVSDIAGVGLDFCLVAHLAKRISVTPSRIISPFGMVKFSSMTFSALSDIDLRTSM